MNMVADDTLAKKKTQSEKGLTESTNFNAMEISKSPKDVLALGRAIVHDLELNKRGSILERWMAHHLAELMDNADKASGKKKTKIESEAVNTILSLWAHRRALPEEVDPLGGYRKAIMVLEQFAPDSNPWARLQDRSEQIHALRDMFDSLARIMVSSILLTTSAISPQASEIKSTSMSETEKRLLILLNQWNQYLPPRTPDIILQYYGDSDSDKQDETKTADLSDDQLLKLAIIENLEEMHTQLETIIQHWKDITQKDIY